MPTRAIFGSASAILLAASLVAAMPAQPAKLTWPKPNADLVAYSRDELSLGLTYDSYAHISLPNWSALNAEICARASSPRAGQPLSQRLPEGHSLSAPLDLVDQYRAPLEFCPGYWPEHHPGKTLADFCYDDYLYRWSVYQREAHNPFLIAKQQVERFNADSGVAHRRLGEALVHWWLGGRDGDAAHTAVLGALAGGHRLRTAIMVEAATEPLLKLIPQSLWEVAPDPTSRAADLRVRSSLSYDAVVNIPRMLQLADERGIKAVVVADHDHVTGAQQAVRTAERLKREGMLSADFQVIIGQQIHCLGAELTAIGLQQRVSAGMTVERTLKEIRRQGAVAILSRPGDVGGTRMLADLDVDGYFIHADLFELFRTMEALYEPGIADKVPLYGSHSRYAQGVGLPYSGVMTTTPDSDAMVAAIRRGDAFAASHLHFPLMGLLATRPVNALGSTLNHYFTAHDRFTGYTRRLLMADHVMASITWDEPIKELMGLENTVGELRALARGDSSLRRTPRLKTIAAQYGAIHIEYHHRPQEFWVKSRLDF